VEDPPLLLGQGRYVADLIPSGALHVAVLRSPYAHALVRSVDAGPALELPGVVAVATAADLPQGAQVPIGFPLSDPVVTAAVLHPVLAVDRVRYSGEPVAVVVAESRYLAEDALVAIEVDYEPLTPVLDMDDAAAEGAELLFPELDRNVVEVLANDGSVDDAVFEGAALDLAAELSIGRHFGSPMETTGVLAEFDPRRGLTVWGPTKSPHRARDWIAGYVELDEHRVHILEPDVGGGFGTRGELRSEDFLVAWLATRLGRPVAWIEDRSEHLTTANHSREQKHRARMAFAADGRIEAMHDRFLNNQGAYVRNNGVAAVAELALALLPGPYRIPRFDGEVTCVVTNTTPTDVYRAPGRYEGTFVRERMLDMAARKLAIDPVDLRMRNVIHRDEYPYAVGTRGLGADVIYDCGDPGRLLEQAVEAIGYSDFRARQPAERDRGRHLGIGVSMFVEKAGFGPWEYGRLEVSPSGRVVLYSGVASVGQGIATTLAQIVAEELTIDVGQVDVVHGDTDRVPFGIGSFASRGAVVGGSATLTTARKLKDNILRVAAQELEISDADLELVDGGVQVKGAPFRRLELGDVARAALPGRRLPEGMDAGLAATSVWTTDHMTYPVGACACTVEVDVESGGIEVLEVVVAYDIGFAINPMLVEGQIHGGVVQGIGGALLEELRYDEDGQPQCTTFMDYLLPSSMDAPRSIKVILDESTPTSLNPLGAKGAGEAGITGLGACVANAVSDALEPFGAEVTKLPITPADVRRFVRAAQ
jgi:carbon-monoxide dehydrogenase large subunit